MPSASAPARLRRRGRPAAVRWPATRPSAPCGTWSSTSSTSTCSAAGGSPCPTWSRPACCEIDYDDLDWARRQARTAGQGTLPALRDADPAQRAEIMQVLLDEMRRALRHRRATSATTASTRLQRASEERLIDPWVLSAERQAAGRHRLPAPGPGPARTARALFLSGARQFGKYLRRAAAASATSTTDDSAAGHRGPVDGADRGRPGDAGRGGSAARRPCRRRTGISDRLPRGRSRSSGGPARGEPGAHDPLRAPTQSGDGPRSTRSSASSTATRPARCAGLLAREHTAQVPRRTGEEREDGVPQRRAAAAVLLADDGARRRHLRASTRWCCATSRPPRPTTPSAPAAPAAAASRRWCHLLLHRQQPRPVLVPPLRARWSPGAVAAAPPRPRQRGPYPLPRPRHLAGRDRPVDWAAPSPTCSTCRTADTADRPTPALQLLRGHHATRRRRRAPSGAPSAVAGATCGALRSTDGDTGLVARRLGRRPGRAAPPSASTTPSTAGASLFRAALRPSTTEQAPARSTTRLTEGDRSRAERRRARGRDPAQPAAQRERRQQVGASDFYPYRYLASEGFLPGYSSRGCRWPPTSRAGRRPQRDGDYLQRPRFLAISEFGPGALIYHEGARYEVTRIQLPARTPPASWPPERPSRCDELRLPPRSRNGARPLRELRRAAGRDARTACCGCRPSSPAAASGSAATRRSAAGPASSWRSRTASRPRRPHGPPCHATIADAERRSSLELAYGDSATVRIANVGRRTPQERTSRGLLARPARRPLAERQARGRRDRRHRASCPWSTRTATSRPQEAGHPVRRGPPQHPRRHARRAARPRPVAVTLDVRPRAGHRGRVPARGLRARQPSCCRRTTARAAGCCSPRPPKAAPACCAGSQAEPDALARVARRPWRSSTSTRRRRRPGGAAAPATRCERGCYDCLLSYGNQFDHTSIDRHAVVALLLRLARRRRAASRAASRRTQTDAAADATGSAKRRRLRRLEARLRRLARGARPAPADEPRRHRHRGARARPDFVYRLPGRPGRGLRRRPAPRRRDVAQRDDEAEERLFDAGWDVVRFRARRRLGRHRRPPTPRLFGPGSQLTAHARPTTEDPTTL